MSVNKAIIVGHLGKDPESRYTASGDPVCNFSVATSESWKDKATGEKREQTEWHRISMFGKLAEIAGQYLKKGSLVYIEGRIKTRKWQTQDGQDRYTTEIQADTMKMLGSKQGGQQQAPGGDDPGYQAPPAPRQPAPQPRQSFDDLGDDIPF